MSLCSSLAENVGNVPSLSPSLACEVIVPSKIPHSQGKRTNRSSLSLHKFKELFRYLRITASDVDPAVLPLLPLLLPPLSSAIVRGPGELAVATIGVAHGGSAIRNRAGLFSHSHCLPLFSCRRSFRKTDPHRRLVSQFGLEK